MIGAPQWLPYIRTQARLPATRSGINKFTFRLRICTSSTIGSVSIPVPGGAPSSFYTDIVSIYIPFLVWLDVLQEFGLILDFQYGTLNSHHLGWTLPMVYQGVHAYIHRREMVVINWSTAELQKRHTQFFHRSAGKMYRVLSRALLEDTPPSVRSMLERISSACTTCASLHQPPLPFPVSLVENELHFSRDFSLNLLWLDGRPEMHIACFGRQLRNAAFIKRKDDTLSQDIVY